MHIDVSKEKTTEIVERSISEIIPSKQEFLKRLRSGEQLVFYVGIDPTADYVHLGHSTNYLLLDRLHKLGHKIIVLVGDFTAMIGDPSDKTSIRVQLTKEQVEKNLKTFKRQIGKILDFDDTNNPIEFKFNSEWLSSLTFKDAVELASNFSVQQMIERDAFQKRIENNKPLYLHEFFYPLMQGYDSVALETDCEIGGTDQLFNMMAGRTLLKRYKNKDKFIVTTTLLENPKTGEKLMSKSLGTGIGLEEPADVMFRKIMQLPDCTLKQLFIDCTRLPIPEIDLIMEKITNGENPRNVKMILANEITEMYHGKDKAKESKESWLKIISNKEIDIKNIPQIVFESDADSIAVLANAMDISKSQVRRLFTQKAIRINESTIAIDDIDSIKNGDVLSVGKKSHFKVKII